MKTEQQIKLSEIEKGTLLYCLAEAMIKSKGYYTCTYMGVPTRIKA